MFEHIHITYSCNFKTYILLNVTEHCNTNNNNNTLSNSLRHVQR